MAAYSFYYTLNTNDLDAFRSEGIRRFALLKNKGMVSTCLDAEQMYAVLYKSFGRILCVISDDEKAVGMMVLVEAYDLFRGKKILNVEMCQLDNVPGVLDCVIDELDRLAQMDSYDLVQFSFFRKGWARKMKMKEGKGYKVTLNIAEKEYGRR